MFSVSRCMGGVCFYFGVTCMISCGFVPNFYVNLNASCSLCISCHLAFPCLLPCYFLPTFFSNFFKLLLWWCLIG